MITTRKHTTFQFLEYLKKRLFSKEISESYKSVSGNSGGFRINIDEYYQNQEKKDELEDVNNSKFAKMILDREKAVKDQ